MNVRPPYLTLAGATFLLLTTVLLDSSASAQSQVFPKWTARFDARKQNDAPMAMATDASGNVFVTGSACLGTNCADQEAVTIKYDSHGNVLWKAWLTSPVGVASGQDIDVDSAGNSYVLFQFMRATTFGVDFPEVVTAKYNPAGVRQWIRFINSGALPDTGFQRSPSHIAVSPLGNVYISYFEFLSASISDSVAQKYDTNGNTIWSRKQTSVQNAFSEFLGLDGHENVYAVVALQGEQDGPDSTTIFKYDSNGNLLNTFPSNPLLGDVQAFHIDSLGASYLAGLLFLSAPCCLRPPPNRVVAKFNPDGSSAWLVNLDQPTIDPNRRFAAITADRVGNTFVAQTISGTGSGTDISVLKFDTTGQQKFLTRFNGHSDDSGKDQAVALTVNSFSEAYVTGQSAGVTGHPEFATIKYDSLGNRQWVERYVGPGDSSDIPVAMTITGGSLIVTGTSVGSGTAQDWATINYVQDAASVSPSSLSFGSETLKTQSAAKTVTLTNTAELSLLNISISVTDDFHVINNCPSSLAAHASCSLGVTFTPTELGTRTGTLTVHDNWAGNAIHPQTVALAGTGMQ